jgi:hypothetical protein
VKYVNYENQVIPEGSLFHPYLHKRLCFSYENELRAIIQNLPKKQGSFDYEAVPTQRGKWVKVNLDFLITDVRISPTAPSWFKDLVQDVCRKYNFKSKVGQSSLIAEPLF